MKARAVMLLERISRQTRARALWVGLLVTGLMAPACHASRATSNQAPLSVREVAPEYRDDWRAVLRAQANDPASEAVTAAADRLLRRGPPLLLEVAAKLAKAQQAYLVQDDTRAITTCDEALARADATVPERVTGELVRLLAFSLARGGDPQRAVAAVEDARARSDVETVELRGATAVALDRNADRNGALLAFLLWRELLADDAAEAAYAERRFEVLAAGLTRVELSELADRAPEGDAAACLRAAAGQGVPQIAPTWTKHCRRLPERLGVLLPRSGLLAGLADGHLSAVTAAVRVLSSERELDLVWEDSGSSPDTARQAARRLRSHGVEVVLGPVGRSNVAAAVSELADLTVVVPGEGGEGVIGVAPSLESRIGLMWAHARASARRGQPVVALAPENGYGRRALLALEAARAGRQEPRLVVREYPAQTTSFKPFVDPHLAQLRRGSPLLVLDAMPRLELIVRQLRRLGLEISASADATLVVIASGEGLRSDALTSSRRVLDGVRLAPAAAPNAASAEFEREYRRQQGAGPNDQALLLWRSLSRVWAGDLSAAVIPAELLLIRGTELVPITPEN